MSEGDKSIHEFDFDLICEYFSAMERQGPGSPAATVTALGFIDNLSDQSKILDIGCGTGGQTVTLAKNARGHITGVDIFPLFIDLFNKKFEKLNLQDRAKGIVASMDNLPFPKEEFDLIWSEGAIYNIGFQSGLKEWHKFLKPRGYIAVSEVSWFTDDRPDEINDFWKREYPEIDTIPKKVSQLQEAGYIPAASFILPSDCWTKNFYEPQVRAQAIFLKKHAGNRKAEELIANQKHEAELYNKYIGYYGYVFYIGKKI